MHFTHRHILTCAIAFAAVTRRLPQPVGGYWDAGEGVGRQSAWPVQILPMTETIGSIFDRRPDKAGDFVSAHSNSNTRSQMCAKPCRVIDEAYMTNPRCWAGVVTLVFVAASPALAQQQSAAGRIKMVSGSAFIVRQGAPIPAQAGQFVFEADGLRTGADGKIGVTLKDDTRVSLGPSSEVQLERFVYAPADGALGLVLKFVHGAAAYVSGRIAKLAPDSIRLETPGAIVGVRGTSLAIRVQSQ